jgi:hypothetical protein
MPVPDLRSTYYLAYKHKNALMVLKQGTTLPTPVGPEYDHSRAICKLAVSHQNWVWPSILDEDYPPPTPSSMEYYAVTIKCVCLALCCMHLI